LKRCNIRIIQTRASLDENSLRTVKNDTLFLSQLEYKQRVEVEKVSFCHEKLKKEI